MTPVAPADIPAEPHGEPEATVDGFDVYVYDSSESEIVPDVYVCQKPDGDDTPHLRLWLAHGRGPFLVYDGIATHEYAPDEPSHADEACCAFDAAEHPPREVKDLMLRYSDAPFIGPRVDTTGENAEADHE